MALQNKPQDDAKGMIDDYQHGDTINEIAERYNHSVEEVEAIVTKPADEEDVVTQVELDKVETVQEQTKPADKVDPTKKGK